MPYRRYRRHDPRRYIKLAGVKFGRRGNSLILFGFLYLLQGISVLGPGGLNLGFDFILGPLWIAAALIAWANAPRPQGRDVWGFFALIIMGVWLVLASLGLFITWLIPGGYPGSPLGLLSAFGWGALFVAMPLNVLGWRENVNPKTGEFE